MTGAAPPEIDAGPQSETRCGFIALIGAPNAGKSTLINRLVGTKVAIVSPKVQTTRTRVLGILTEGASQLCLIDTPGLFTPRRRLDRSMVLAASEGAAEADIVCLLVDVSRPDPIGDSAIALERIKAGRSPAWLVLNKVDQIRPEALLPLTGKFAEEADFAETFMISALKGSGVEDLKRALAAAVPPGPWLYPEDELTDMPMRLAAAEIVREKLFNRLHQELPYASTVETETWEDREDGSVRIGCVIYVERPGQKAIVLGKGGRTIKEIGTQARTELEEMLEGRVHLNLFVKVRAGWNDDPDRYREWGLDPGA